MATPFLALITPLSTGDQPPLGTWGGYRPPYVDIGGPGPQPPGSPGQPPLGFWGGRPPSYVDIGGPGPQPPSGAHPSHPIWRPDLGYWGGRPPTYPDIGFPGPQPHPEHPIVIPPPPGSGSGAPPIAVQLPVFPWSPSHPIELPPDVAPPQTPDGRPVEWKVVWTPQTGWIVIGIPTGPTPTPSR
jgi:hypothetical protein